VSYIGYGQIEELLKEYNTIKILLKSLNIELESAKNKEFLGDNSEVIYSESMKTHPYDALPKKPEGSISDKTGNIATSYGNKTWEASSKLKKEISCDILDVSYVIEKLDNAFRCLKKTQENVIKMFYFDKYTWDEVSHDLNITRRQAQYERTAGIRRMVMVSRIEKETYESVIKKIKVDKDGDGYGQ
jgi:predicted DNA-binding protein YlxM (UPF0122 family)